MRRVKCSLTYSARLPVSGCARNNDRFFGVHGHFVGAVVGVGVVQRGQAVAQLAHGGRERVIRGGQAGPHGVATNGRAAHHFQHREDGGLGLKGQVGVPFVGHAAVGGRQLKQVGVLGEGVLDVRVAFQLAKVAAKGHMLLHAQGLPGEEQHLVV